MVILIAWSPIVEYFGIYTDSIWLTYVGHQINLGQTHRPNCATPIGNYHQQTHFMIFISIYIAFISWAYICIWWWGTVVCNLIRYRVVMTDHFLILKTFPRRKSADSGCLTSYVTLPLYRDMDDLPDLYYRRSVLVGCIWRLVTAACTTLTAGTRAPCMFQMHCTHLLSVGLSLFAGNPLRFFFFFFDLGCG
jgi:hypothetical protein